MTYRERRERRADRREEWAASRSAKAEATHKASHDAVAQMPLGEPIHPGAKGRRQRNAIDRSRRQMEKSLEHSQMAEKHERSAETIRSQLDKSVYSDDADAVERLEGRIAENEAKRAQMKADNAAFRKANKERLKELSSFLRNQSMPYPSYALSNLGGRISADRKRLAQLKG